MKLAGLGQDDFITILKVNGYSVLSTDYWEMEGVKRIVLGKDGHTFVLRLRGYIFYPEVVHKFLKLGVSNIPPEQADEYEACVKAYTQDLEMRIRYAEGKQKEKEKEGLEGDDKNKSSNKE